MKALIFGAGGQVGRALAESAPKGAETIALTREECDVADPAAVADAVAAARPDILFNAAAHTAVDRAESEPELAENLNALAPRRMAEAARGVGARFVHVSTDFVFDGEAGRPYPPEAAANPLGVYGRTKRAGEQAVLAADPAALIVRTAWVYAPWGANFVRTMLRLMRERDRLAVVADQVGTPTYAPSLAGALWRLAQAGASGIHHFTDSGVASWYDFAVAIQEEALALGLLDRAIEITPIPTSAYPTPARRPACSVLDKSATWTLLGAAPPHWRINLRTCLRVMDRGS